MPIISAAQLIAIDARWSQYAIAEPFSAEDLEAGGRRRDLDAPRSAPSEDGVPPSWGKILGRRWNDDVTSALEVTGLHNPAWEDFAETCGPACALAAEGRSSMSGRATARSTRRSAWLFLDFELDRMLKAAERRKATGRPATRPTCRSAWSSRPKASRLGSTKSAAFPVAAAPRLHGSHRWRSRLTVRYPSQGDLFEELRRHA